MILTTTANNGRVMRLPATGNRSRRNIAAALQIFHVVTLLLLLLFSNGKVSIVAEEQKQTDTQQEKKEGDRDNPRMITPEELAK